MTLVAARVSSVAFGKKRSRRQSFDDRRQSSTMEAAADRASSLAFGKKGVGFVATAVLAMALAVTSSAAEFDDSVGSG
jgi:hypothetical protein